jgi:integrase
MSYIPTIWKPPPKEYPHVSEAEAKAIWTACLKPEYRLFTKVLWFTGLRINEVLAIQCKNVMNGPDGYCLVVTRLKKGENTHPERLPISRELGEALRDFAIASKLQQSNRVFTGHENTYRYELRQAAKRAGLENWRNIHPHLFRHGFVYHKVSQGVHPLVLTRLVGHSNLGTTQIYYQPQEQDLRKAMEL